ncbi:MAG: hypothetical protein ACXU7D_05165 [Burkholderiaceae bacterium]
MNVPAQCRVSLPSIGKEEPNVLAFELGSGMCFGILGAPLLHTAQWQQQLPPSPKTAYVQSDGGLISNLRVGENMILPAVYHFDTLPEKLETGIVSILAELGYDNIAATALLAKLPADLTVFERRLVSFVRAVILEPAVIVYDSLWADLSEDELERVSGFDTIFRKHCPASVSIYQHNGNSFPFEVAFNQTIVL